MFYVLFIICILGGLSLGVWMAMRHAEIYDLRLKTSDNSTIASVGEVSDTFYDTEHVSEVEANPQENAEESLLFQHSLDTENANATPAEQTQGTETVEETASDEVTQPIVEELALNTPTEDEPAVNPTHEIDQAASFSEPPSPVQAETLEKSYSQQTAGSLPPVEMIAEWVELPKDCSLSEAETEIILMSSGASCELETLANIYNETQNMLVEFENVAPEAMETQWISNAGDAKYVNRVICRPKV